MDLPHSLQHGRIARAATPQADERALVTLRYYDDRSVAECAAITGLTEANVKVRLHRIRKKLYAMITSATNEYK